MAKTSKIDLAIAALKGERDVLDMAIRKLEAQQTAKPAPKKKARVDHINTKAIEGIAP